MAATTAAAATQAVGAMAGAILPRILSLMDDVMNQAQNREDLRSDVDRMKSLLIDINQAFEDRKKPLPKIFVDALFPRVQEDLEKVKPLLERSDPQQCLYNCNLKRAIKIRQWKTQFEKLFEQIHRESETVLNAQKIAEFTGGRRAFKAKIKKIFSKVCE